MTFPVVLDLNGTIRDWAWLRAKYGNVTYLEAAGYPKFQLSKVEEMEGPQTLIVNVEAENGSPHSGQPVALSWPSLAGPSQDLPVIPAGSKSCYTSRGVIQRTENGCTGFGLGGGSYIHDPAVGGPYSVFVLSPSTYSDCLTGNGLAGRHESHGAVPADVSDCDGGAWPIPIPSLSLALMTTGRDGGPGGRGAGTRCGGAGAVGQAFGGIAWRGRVPGSTGLDFGYGWLLVCASRCVTRCAAGARRRGARRAGRRRAGTCWPWVAGRWIAVGMN